MGRIENDGVQRRVIHQPQPKIEPKPKVEPKTLDASGGATRRNELRMQGQQQRDRIERLYGAGGASVINFACVGNFLQKLPIIKLRYL